MTNMEKYSKAFVDILKVEPENLAGLTYQSVELWDSVGHMELVNEIEDAFDIQFDTADIIDFSSFEKGIEILKGLGVDL